MYWRTRRVWPRTKGSRPRGANDQMWVWNVPRFFVSFFSLQRTEQRYQPCSSNALTMWIDKKKEKKSERTSKGVIECLRTGTCKKRRRLFVCHVHNSVSHLPRQGRLTHHPVNLLKATAHTCSKNLQSISWQCFIDNRDNIFLGCFGEERIDKGEQE